MRVILAGVATLILFLMTSAYAAVPVSSCALASEGIFKGAWVKHRIYMQEEVVYGANDLGSILSQLESLREQGVCR